MGPTKLLEILKIENLSDDAKSLSLKFFYFTLATAILTTISSTFLVLHVIDTVEKDRAFELLGTIIAVQFFVSAMTDFPTGVLADWVGHKWILTIAYILFALSSTILIIADSFAGLLIAFIVLALANGQASGALQAWFDNNYKVITMIDDPEREIYREFLGKSSMLFQYGSSIFFIIGGIIATLFPSGRLIVFGLQAIFMLILAFAFSRSLDNVSAHVQPEKSSEGYFELLTKGLRFAISSRLTIFFIAASVIWVAVAMVWYNLVLMPVYFGYTGSDFGAGTLRWIIWFGSAYFTGKAGSISKKLNERDWIPRIRLIFVLAFFGLTGVLVRIFPIDNPKFNLAAVGILILIFVGSAAFGSVGELLTRKLFLEIVPDDMRNSIYSLLPTLGLIIGTPIVYLLGLWIADIGFSTAIFIFVLFALIGVVFEFLAMQYYYPSARETVGTEIVVRYDVYSVSNFESSSYTFPKRWQLSEKVKLIWDVLLETVMEDNKISEDERDLLDSIMVNLREYAQAVEHALVDGVITQEEKDELLELRKKLIKEAESTAFKDEIISPDEVNIIAKLAKVMTELDLKVTER
ncbi:MAG: MFS transporter [Candidatus Kariarchaeaceae archaeon]|jgi:MFS family permease